MYANRSYALAAKPKSKFPGGIFISADTPTRSLRSVTINGEEMVLIVGESHKTGQGIDTMKHYKALETFGQQVFGLETIPYRWSAQDLTTLDKVPYIGEMTSGQPNILIATGYRKWGMSNGTAAALLFRDIVLDEPNRFPETILTFKILCHILVLKTFFNENANVVGELIKGKLQTPKTKPNDVTKRGRGYNKH